MRKLLAIGLLALFSTGCAYKGACETNGYKSRPYNDDSKYTSVNCTKYRSIVFPEISAETPEAMMKAVEDKQIERDKDRCVKYGIADKTEAMTSCLMEKSAAREATARDSAQREHKLRMQEIQQQQQYSQPAYQPRRIEPTLLQYQPIQRHQPQPVQQYEPIKQTDFSCMSDCQKAGRMYGYCQSKCSY